MKDSAALKRENKIQIRRLLRSGKSYTKQQIALQTGLSVASCNTYLNEMETTGEVTGEKQKLHEVGRNAMVYTLNEDFESILCLYFALIQGVKSVTAAVLSPTGRILHQQVRRFEPLDATAIEQESAAAFRLFPSISQVIVGTPSIAENGVIRHSDIPELENVPLKTMLETKFQRPVFLANDMHYKVYGYYRQEQISDKIVTLVNYPSGVLPGTATVHKGTLLTGRNLFAGMVGFLDYGMSLEQQIQRLHRPAAEPLIIQASIALISILNPHLLLFTGDLLLESDLERIRAACRTCIPEEYMPDFAFIPSTDQYYLMGMYWKAMDIKDETASCSPKNAAGKL